MASALKWLELDSLDNIPSIVTDTLIGTYVCDDDRMIIADIYAQDVIGGGDYSYYATKTPSGLSEGIIGTKTTRTLAVGETVLCGQSRELTLRNGDVLKIYLKGQAGDNLGLVDTRVNFYEDLSVGFPAGAIEFTYTMTDSGTGFPVADVEIWVSTDVTGFNIIWKGYTDTFGIARDVAGNKPHLDAGTYYFWRHKLGYSETDPDVEIVS